MTPTRTHKDQQPVTVFTITMPGGKTATCWQFASGEVDGQGRRWDASQWNAAQNKIKAAGATVAVSQGFAFF